MTGWRPGFATSGEAREAASRSTRELYHQVVTFRAGRMVRIEYFGEWSDALEAAGLEE